LVSTNKIKRKRRKLKNILLAVAENLMFPND